MVLNEFQLFGRDIDRVALDHIRIDRGGRTVDRGDELVGQGTVIADLTQCGDDGFPVDMTKASGKAVVVGDVEIKQPLARQADGIMHIRLFHVQVIGVQTDAALGMDGIGQRQSLGGAVQEIGLEPVQRFDGDLDPDLLGMGKAFPGGLNHPAPFFGLGPVGHHLADGGGHQRDDLPLQLGNHRQNRLHIIDRPRPLPLIARRQIARPQGQGHGTPATDAVLFQQGAGLADRILRRLPRYLDAFIAIFLDAPQRDCQRLCPHPVVC